VSICPSVSVWTDWTDWTEWVVCVVEDVAALALDGLEVDESAAFDEPVADAACFGAVADAAASLDRVP
jgi:hypothetical protein